MIIAVPGDDGAMDPVLTPPMAAQSAVLVPEGEQAVGGHRDRLDRAAAWGVPAHVTVPYPFGAPSAITAAVIAGVADAVGSASAFDGEFAATAWLVRRLSGWRHGLMSRSGR